MDLDLQEFSETWVRVPDERHEIHADVLALTFDDCPSVWTAQILDLLETHDAHATFFVLGSTAVDESGRARIRRIIDNGASPPGATAAAGIG